jgi:hypothetical protein
MQKFTLFFALFFYTAIAWGQTPPQPDDGDDWEEIIILPKTGPKSGTVDPISVWYSQKLCMILLETDCKQGPIGVSIKDETNFLVFEQMVDGNQSTIKVFLPLLSFGYYKLTIEIGTCLYVGKFMIY